MKSKFYKLLGLVCTVSILVGATPAEAYWNHGGYYHNNHHRYHHGYYHKCKFVGGYWRHGHWVPRHRVCWR